MREKMYKVCEDWVNEFNKRIQEELAKENPDKKKLAKLEEQYHFWFDNLCRIEK